MQHQKNKMTYGEKLALAATSLPALAILPTGAEAGIIHVTGSPVTLSFADAPGSIALWDVDGAGGAAPIGQLMRYSYTSSSSNTILFQNLGAGNSILVNYYTNVANLPGSFHVGPNLAGSLYFYNATNPGAILHSYGAGVHTHNGFIEGDQKIGFRFTDGLNQFYGYSNWNVDFANQRVTITDWYYNDIPDASIHVVPEPSTASLALIGLGAAGVRTWRRRKKAQALAA